MAVAKPLRGIAGDRRESWNGPRGFWTHLPGNRTKVVPPGPISGPFVFKLGGLPCQGRGRGFKSRLPLSPSSCLRPPGLLHQDHRHRLVSGPRGMGDDGLVCFFWEYSLAAATETRTGSVPLRDPVQRILGRPPVTRVLLPRRKPQPRVLHLLVRNHREEV